LNDRFLPDGPVSPALRSVLAGLSVALAVLPAAAADAPRLAPGAVELGVLEMRATVRPVPPAYQHTPVPRYPADARQRGLEGVVVLSVLVRSDGRVEEARVAASSGAAVLDEVALEAVRKWTFVPARQGGRPVESVVEVPVKFALRAP
jgi:protein TonB